jgi:hypothetical protein
MEVFEPTSTRVALGYTAWNSRKTDELQWIFKEVVAAEYRYLSRDFPRETEENYENPQSG